MKKIIRLTELDLKRLVERVLVEQHKSFKEMKNVQTNQYVKGFSSFPENDGIKSSVYRNGETLKVFPGGRGNKIFISKVDKLGLERAGFADKTTFVCFVKRVGSKLMVTCPQGPTTPNPKILGFTTEVEL